MPRPPTTAPIALYRDPEVFERERQAIFSTTWQFLGMAADLVRPGDYVADVIAGFPVVVVCDESGTLRAYHNVCPHRAGPLVTEAKGRCDRALVCRFHGWRYGFDGRLLEATDFGPADGFDTADFGLLPVRAETWRGVVFINLDAAVASLAEILSPLDERLPPPIHRPARIRDRHPVACNWKVFVENYLDGYHQEGVHPDLASKAGAQRHEVNLQGDIALYQAPARQNAAESLWAWVWPNLGVSFYRGVLMLESARPEGPDRTVIEHVFLHEPEDPGVDAAILNAERITHEDALINERVQQNLDAGVFQRGVLSPTHEEAVARFQARVARVLAE